MAPAYSNTQFTQSHSSLVNPNSTLSELVRTSGHETTSGQHRAMTRSMNHRRNPRQAASLYEGEPSRSTDTYSYGPHSMERGSHPGLVVTSDAVPMTNHNTGNNTNPSSRRAPAGGQYESAARRRRNRGAYAGQGSSDPNGTNGKAEDRGSTAAFGSGSGSGSGSSSSGRAGSGGMSLTEENVRRTSSYFEHMRRETASERGESSGRRASRNASLLATLEDVGSKLSGVRR